MYSCNDCDFSTARDEAAYNHSRNAGHCVAEGIGGCNAYCRRGDH